MIEHELDLIVAVHDGAHFIETPNPVLVLSGFKSLGAAAVVLPRDGDASLIVTPAWDAERAAECCPSLRITAAEDMIDGLASGAGQGHCVGSASPGSPSRRWEIAGRLAQTLPQASSADEIVFDAARRKTDEEIAHAREATRIAELGYAAPHRDRAPRHERGRACGRAQVVHPRRSAPRTISCCSAPGRTTLPSRPRTGA